MFRTQELQQAQAFLTRNSEQVEDSWHQSIMNIGYVWWQSPDNKDKSYHHMIEHLSESFGEPAALLTLLGKYNQQVDNGGHSQYYDNGYTSSTSSGFMGNHNNDLSLHVMMLALMQKFDLHKHEIGKKVFQNASKMEVHETQDCDCDEGYYDVFHDDEGDRHENWIEGDDNCGCRTYWSVACSEILDEEYYCFNGSWIESIEAALVQVLGPFKQAA